LTILSVPTLSGKTALTAMPVSALWFIRNGSMLNAFFRQSVKERAASGTTEAMAAESAVTRFRSEN
jgi:hypothetical protein